MPFNIATVLYPGFEELDVAGPFEVFGVAARLVEHEWSQFTTGAEPVVKGSHRLSVNVDYTFDSAPEANMLVIPGGQTGAALADPRLVDYVKRAGADADLLMSVCTGTLVLYRAGFLQGRRATTYWGAMEMLRGMDGLETVEGERWVHDGNVITAAGVSAGIDAALYVVGQLSSPETARAVQRHIEYSPAPPYAEVPAA